MDVLKEWLGSTVERELSAVLQLRTKPSIDSQHIKSIPYEDDGSNLRVMSSRSGVVQIIKFETFEDPIQVHISDKTTAMKATIASSAARKFKTEKRKRVTEGTLGGLVQILSFEIVATHLGPRPSRVTLLIKEFKSIGSEGSVMFGHPRAIMDSWPETVKLIEQLRFLRTQEFTDSQLQTERGSLGEGSPVQSQIDSGYSINGSPISTQVPFATQAPQFKPRVEYSVNGSIASVQKAVNESRSQSRQKSAVTRALANDSSRLMSNGAKSDEPRDPQFNRVRISTPKKMNGGRGLLDLLQKADISIGPSKIVSTANGVAADHTPRRLPSVIEGIGTLNRDIVNPKPVEDLDHQPRKVKTRISHREVTIPKNQQALLDRPDSFLPPEPGTRGPVANVPVKILQSLNAQAERRATRSMRTLKSKDPDQVPAEELQHQRSKPFSDAENDSKKDVDSDVPISSWSPTPSPRQALTLLPPDSSIEHEDRDHESERRVELIHVLPAATSNTEDSTKRRLSETLISSSSDRPLRKLLRRKSSAQMTARSSPSLVHTSAGEEPRPFRCPVHGCVKSYKNSPGLKQHINRIHNVSSALGGDSTTIDSSVKLKISMNDHGFACAVCGKRFTTPTEVTLHKQHSPCSSPPRGLDQHQINRADDNTYMSIDGDQPLTGLTTIATQQKHDSSMTHWPEHLQRIEVIGKPSSPDHEYLRSPDPFVSEQVPQSRYVEQQSQSDLQFGEKSFTHSMVTNHIDSPRRNTAVPLLNDEPSASFDSELETTIPHALSDRAKNIYEENGAPLSQVPSTATQQTESVLQVKRTPYSNEKGHRLPSLGSSFIASPSTKINGSSPSGTSQERETNGSLSKINTKTRKGSISKGQHGEHASKSWHSRKVKKPSEIAVPASQSSRLVSKIPLDVALSDSVIPDNTGVQVGTIRTTLYMAPSSIDGESEREVVSEDIQLQIDSQSQRIRDVSPPQDKDIIAAEITSWGVCDSPQPLATQSQELKPTLTMYYGDRETKRKAPEFEQLPPNVTKRRKHLKASSTPLFSQDQHHIQDPSFLAQQYRREFLAARRDSISTPRGETEVTEGKASDIFSSSEGTHQRLLPPRKGSTPFIEDHLDSITNSKNNAPNALSQSNTEPQNLLQSTSISESYLTDDLEATHEMETKALNAMGLSDLDDQALLHSLSEHPAPHIDDVLTTLQSTEKKDLETRSLSDADFQLLLPSTENPAPRPNDDLEPTYRLEETTFAALDAFSDMHQDALPSQDSPCGDRIEIEPVVEENAFNVIESDGDPQLLLPVEKDSEPHLSDNVEPIHPLEEKLSDAMSLSNDQRQSLSPFGEQSVPHHDDNPESTLDLAENATDVTRPYVEWRPESSVFQKDGSYHRDDSTKGRSGVEEVAPGEIIPPVDLDKGTFQEMNGLIGSDRQCNETDSESARSTKQDARATPAADPTDDGAIQNAQLAQTGQPIVNSGLTVMDVEIKETTTDDQVSFLPEMPADHVSLSPPLDIYHRFKNAYPEYSGDVKHFIAISKKIKILVENDHMEHRSLWDDFIIRHKTEYPQYLQYCTEIVEDPIPYERYYHNEVDERKYSSRIITPGNLGEVFALECDVSDSTENRSVPQRLVDLRVDPRAPEQKLRSPSRSVRRISFESQTPPSSSPLPNHSQQELPVYSEPDRGGLDLTSEASTIPIMTHIEKRKPTSASPTPKYLQNGNTIGSNNDGLDHTPMILSKPSSITNESYRLSSKAPVLEYTQHDHNSDLKGCDNQLERTPETLPNSSEANVASHKSPSPKPMIEHSPQHYGMKNKTAFVDQKLSSTLDPELSNNGTRKSSLSSSVSLSQGVIDLTGDSDEIDSSQMLDEDVPTFPLNRTPRSLPWMKSSSVSSTPPSPRKDTPKARDRRPSVNQTPSRSRFDNTPATKTPKKASIRMNMDPVPSVLHDPRPAKARRTSTPERPRNPKFAQVPGPSVADLHGTVLREASKLPENGVEIRGLINSNVEEWWKDDNTPFKSFARAYASIKSGNGNSYAKPNAKDDGVTQEVDAERFSQTKLKKLDIFNWYL